MAHRYSSPDMLALLADADLDALDARLRLGQGLMSSDEDRIIKIRLKSPLEVLEANESPSQWMTQAFYRIYALRSGLPCEAWRAEQVDGFWVFKRQVQSLDEASWVTRDVSSVPRVHNDWLAWELEELASACSDMGIGTHDGLALQVPYRDDRALLRWDSSFGFQVDGGRR